jgi:hypothetical protein
MNPAKRTMQDRVVLGLLAALVATNVVLAILLRSGGPLIGTVLYAVLLVLVWRGQPYAYRAAVVGGLVGLAVHVVEVAILGWSAYPALMALNLILPAALAPSAWWASPRGRQENKDR